MKLLSKNRSTEKIPREREKEIRTKLLAYLKPQSKMAIAGLLCAAGVSGITSLLAVATRLSVNAMAQGEVGTLNLICIIVVVVFWFSCKGSYILLFFFVFCFLFLFS